MTFPWRDWQFWATSAAFALALLWLFRGLLPIPALRARRRRARGRQRVRLTIGGKPPEK